MIAPAIGPTIHTTASSHTPPTSAGPNHRAGFIAAPVYGPKARMSNAIASPIVKPAVLVHGPLPSTAVPNTTKTRKKVRIASRTMPVPAETFDPRVGAPARPLSNRSAPTTKRSRSAPTIPPRSCATM